jgi:hypothetical protein
MTSKRHSLKKSRKGGMLNRMVASAYGAKVKTFCCNQKTSDPAAWGTTNSNVGNYCERSQTGQCDVIQSKFRCFDTQDNEGGRDEINEVTGKTKKKDPKGSIVEADEKCKYVASTAGKLVSTVGNVASVIGNIGAGGKKKSKRRSSKKKRRTNKRK